MNITEKEVICRLERAEIGLYNASLLVNGEYGRSLTDPSLYLISPNDQPYNYLSYSRMIRIVIKFYRYST